MKMLILIYQKIYEEIFFLSLKIIMEKKIIYYNLILIILLNLYSIAECSDDGDYDMYYRSDDEGEYDMYYPSSNEMNTYLSSGEEYRRYYPFDEFRSALLIPIEQLYLKYPPIENTNNSFEIFPENGNENSNEILNNSRNNSRNSSKEFSEFLQKIKNYESIMRKVNKKNIFETWENLHDSTQSWNTTIGQCGLVDHIESWTTLLKNYK